MRLLQRTTRKLALTSVGEQYHRHCVAMREDAQAADEAIDAARREPQGLVRVACPVTLAQTTIGPMLPQFLALHPKVRIDLRISNRAVDLIEEGFDIALRVRTTLDNSGSLVVKHLSRSHGRLYASPAQLARQGQPPQVEDLQAMDTVSMAAQDGRATWTFIGPQGQSRQVIVQPRYVADDLLTLKFAVMQGLGLCALPEYLCDEEIRQGLLVPVLPDWTLPPGLFHAVYPSRRGLIPAVRALLDFLGERVAREGWVV